MLKNNKGTTLVELIVGMAIMALIMSGMYGIFMVSNSIYQNTIYQAQTTPNVNSALLLISSELQPASITSITNSGQQIHYIYPTAPTDRTIYYDQSQKAIIFTQNGAIAKIIGVKTVQSLLFVKDTTNFKKYQVTIQYNSSNITTNAINITSNIMTGGI